MQSLTYCRQVRFPVSVYLCSLVRLGTEIVCRNQLNRIAFGPDKTSRTFLQCMIPTTPKPRPEINKNININTYWFPSTHHGWRDSQSVPIEFSLISTNYNLLDPVPSSVWNSNGALEPLWFCLGIFLHPKETNIFPIFSF